MPNMAGTIERRREHSKRSGVNCCCKELGGTIGLETGMIREVGRCRD